MNAISSVIRKKRLLGGLVWAALMLSGCSGIISNTTGSLADQLSAAILDNNDLKTVEDGAPAYLLMMDGLIRNDPQNPDLLRSAANLYASYSDVFVKDPERARRLTDKALEYALRSLCSDTPDCCGMKHMGYDEFKQRIGQINPEAVSYLYTLGSSWASWISTHRDDWNAVAEMSRVEAIMLRVVELDETWRDGGAYMYLGTLATLLPPALGGNPERGREYFEKAIQISKEKNLMVKVIYARQYARLVFDRELHDRLLGEVLKSEAHAPGYTLINTLARDQAEELLKTAENYF